MKHLDDTKIYHFWYNRCELFRRYWFSRYYSHKISNIVQIFQTIAIHILATIRLATKTLLLNENDILELINISNRSHLWKSCWVYCQLINKIHRLCAGNFTEIFKISYLHKVMWKLLKITRKYMYYLVYFSYGIFSFNI